MSAAEQQATNAALATLAATGEKIGITPAQVRTIETRALRKLRSDPKLRRWHDRELENRA